MRGSTAALILAGLLGVSLWAGLRGLDFGRHWDERHLVGQAHKALKSELLLPRSYHYPSVPFWLATAGLALGEVPSKVDSPSLRPDGQRTAVDPPPAVAGDPVLRIRAIFLVFSVLIGLWTFLLGRAAQLRSGPALLAAGLVGTSFELSYHQRWIAPDAVMAMAAAAALWCLVEASGRGADRSSRPAGGARALGPRGWLVAGAVAAGLCCGTKYTGGILLVGVLAVAMQASETKEKIWRLVVGVAVFGAAFLVSTPGALLDHGLFWKHIEYELAHYAQGHGNYTVEGFLEHLGHAGRWLGGAALSPWAPVAVALAALSLAGFVLLLQRRHLRGLLVGLPVLYLVYMAQQKVFFPRNLLILLPFMVIAAGFAAQALLDRLRPRWVLGMVLALPVVAHAGFLVHASETIRDRRTDRWVAEFKAWCADHPEAGLQASPQVLRATGPQGCFGAGPGQVLYLSEGHPDSRRYPSLGAAWYREVFGPADVSLRWQRGQVGSSRIRAIRSRVGRASKRAG